jgi:hypothetical protein
LPAERDLLMPGENCAVKLTLLKPMPIMQNLQFSIRDGERTRATGVVTGECFDYFLLFYSYLIFLFYRCFDAVKSAIVGRFTQKRTIGE